MPSIQVKHLVEDYLDDARVLAYGKRRLTIEIQVPDGEWLMGMILSYGPTVEVLKPQSLVHKVRERVAAMADIYSDVRHY